MGNWRETAARITVLMMLACSQAVAQSPERGDEERRARFQLGAHGGTLGLGVTAGFDMSDRFAVRGLFNTFDFGFNTNQAGNAYAGDLALQSFGVLGDWHPFGGGWRVTGGTFRNNNELLVGTEGSANIGPRRYAGNLDINLTFAGNAPYFGIGWTSGRDRQGLGFGFDAGALYHGTPRLSATGAIRYDGSFGPGFEELRCAFSVTQDANASVDCSQIPLPDDARALLQSEVVDPLIKNLETEHRELSDELVGFRWYPVLSFGVSYRF